MITNTLTNITTATTITGSVGSYLVSDGTGIATWSTGIDKKIEFIEFALELMGVDIKYSDFENMSKSDRIAMIREIKINKIID